MFHFVPTCGHMTHCLQELERAFSHHDASADSSAPDGAAQLVFVPTASDPWPWPQTHVLQVQVGGGPEPPKQKDRQEKHDDFYANVGDAIRTLREDVPNCLRSDLNCTLPLHSLCVRWQCSLTTPMRPIIKRLVVSCSWCGVDLQLLAEVVDPQRSSENDMLPNLFLNMQAVLQFL